MASPAQRRIFKGTDGAELIHGPVHHHAYAGAAGWSLKHYDAPVQFWRRGKRVALDGHGFAMVNAGEAYAFEVPRPEATQVTTAFFPEAQVRLAWAGLVDDADVQLDTPDHPGEAREFTDWLHRARPLLPAFLARLRAERDAGGLPPARVDEMLAMLLQSAMEAEAGLSKAKTAFAPLRAAQRNEVFRRISTARAFIEANARRDLTLDEMAGAACLSKFYFLRRFKAVVGQTPAAFLRQVRLERAAEAVAGGRQDLTQIALDAGYSDLAAFSRGYRRRFGAAPSSAVRKGNRGQARPARV